jgi:hypothetical protein
MLATLGFEDGREQATIDALVPPGDLDAGAPAAPAAGVADPFRDRY